MKLLNLFKDRYFLVLAIVILLASILTFRFLIYQTTFGYDMARDAFHAYDILFNQNIKIIGPGTDIPGLNHGVLWFYFLVIPYFIAQQDPQIAVIFFYILAVSTIPFVWKLAMTLFKDRSVALVSTVLYSFSPLVVPFSSWMSNPILCLYITPLLLLLIYGYIKKQTQKKAFLIGLLYGLLIQSQLANLLLLPSILIYVIVFKVKVRIGHFLTFAGGLVLSLASFILVELNFGGRGLVALFNYLTADHGGGAPDIAFLVSKLTQFFELTVFPFEDFPVGILMLIVIIGLTLVFKKAKKPILFLLIWISNLALFSLFDTGVSHSYFVFIPSIAAGVILVSFVFKSYISNKLFLGILVAILVVFQFIKLEGWLRDDFSPAAIQRSNTARVYKKVVDFTYQTSNGEPFIITTVTNPLFINTTWEYLYEFYGKRKYGYAPYFGGRSQEGYQFTLENKPFGTNYRYLIIESTIGIPDIYVTKAIYEEDKVSDIVDEAKYGYVIVQKRVFKENKGEIEIPESLKNTPVLYE